MKSGCTRSRSNRPRKSWGNATIVATDLMPELQNQLIPAGERVSSWRLTDFRIEVEFVPILKATPASDSGVRFTVQEVGAITFLSPTTQCLIYCTD
jgi:hypothetical protein